MLAIDDSPEIHSLLEVRLRAEGLVLRHARDAVQGLALARELNPDLILLDVEMPDRSGFDVCVDLKRDERTAEIPVVFLAGDAGVGAKVRGLDLGAVDYITKPFHTAELLARVRAALRTKRYQDLLNTRARVDALTGLWNRSYFDQRLAEEARAAARYRRSISLLMVDLDHFKSLNDSYGHPVGDRVLHAVGDTLHRVTRGTDAACRYGGEEFGIIAPDTNCAGAWSLAGRLRTELELVIVRPDRVGITASIGIASTELISDANEVTDRNLVNLADNALYEAKRRGRNQALVAAQNGEYLEAPQAEPASA